MYEIIFDEKAIEFLEKLDHTEKKRIFEKIMSTKEKPLHYFDHLTERSEYKLRIGNYRAIADINEKKKTITILIIGHRKNIYKRYV